MNTFERVLYRDQGKVKTATLRNVKEGPWTLSGIRVNGQGDNVMPNDGDSLLTVHLTRSVISRTPMHLSDDRSALVVT